MANRQVRLDPDVEPLVAEVMAELGTSSYSRATNEVLRDALADRGDDLAAAHVSASRAPTSSRASVSRAKGTIGKPKNRRGAQASTAPRRSRCAHSVARRIGDRCGDCGERV